MRFLGKKYLYFYTIISVLLLIVLSPLSTVKLNSLLADLTQKLIVQEVNPVRESYGFLTLETNEKLTKAAQLKAQDMIKRDYFDHVGPEGETPWTWFNEVDYQYAAAGENLAMNCSDPVLLINAWLNSPSHARNILNGYFTDIGIGIAEGTMNGRKTNVVVMFLGRERTTSLSMASNMNEEYQEIAAAESGSVKPQRLFIEEPIEEVKPSEPLVTKTVEEEDLYKENLFLSIVEKKQDINVSSSENTIFKMFLIDDAPAVFLYSPIYIYPVNKKVKGIEIEKIAQPSYRFSQIEDWYIKTKRIWK